MQATIKIDVRHLVLLALLIAALGVGGGWLGANFQTSWFSQGGPSEFQEYLDSQDIPDRGRSRLQQFLGDKWLEEHPSYSGQDGEDWKVAAEKSRLINYIDCVARGDFCIQL
ncbi:MAG: hypothetical protein O2783_03670 [Chloroflexi bacterium]|nr:hypothetical protein [Chloroflexota bacterium]